MATSNQTRGKWRLIAILTIIGAAFGFGYTALRIAVGVMELSVAELEHASRTGAFIGLCVSIFMLFYVYDERGAAIRRLNFLAGWVVIDGASTVIIAAAILLQRAVTALVYDDFGFFSGYLANGFWLDVLISFLVFVVVALFMQLRPLLGPGTMWKVVSGRYHHPRKERRIYMFLDMKNSTAIAERLGDERTHALIAEVFFDADRRRPFYFRGTSGSFAWMINMYIDRVAHLRAEINDLIDAGSIEEQREIYDAEMQRKFWSRSIRFAMGRDTTLSMLGVPRAQREEVERHYTGGISQFVRDCIDTVLADLPLADNYFWRVYLTSEYTPECCPEYLREENFERLKAGLVDHVGVHTNSVQGFLESAREPISRFVLLDHMDWMSGRYFDLLESEWQAIVDRAAPGARIIWRSGGLRADFVNRARVSVDGQRREVGELLTYHNDLAEELHRQDRVHTYGSFYISDLAA